MCEYCDKEKRVKSMNYCGSGELRITKSSEDLPPLIDIFGTDKQLSFEIAYCPMCGKKLLEI
jgi:hypothetical protein